MGKMDTYLGGDELHPIDIVQILAADQKWEFTRPDDNRISMNVAGQWREYGVTLAWSETEDVLHLIASFDTEPPSHRRVELYEALNRVNDVMPIGGFSFWDDEGMMVYRYSLLLADGQSASMAQIDKMISVAVSSCEKFYPAFQLVTWGEKDPRDAMQVAIAEVYGHA